MNTTTKRYRLLKDLPNAKAGHIYRQCTASGSYIPIDGVRGSLSKDIVENSPDWFEEVKDAPFEIGGFEINYPTTKSDKFLKHSFYANEIPAGKIPAIQNAIFDIVNNVEVNGGKTIVISFYFEQTTVGGKEYVFETNKSISYDKFPAIRKAIEDIVNGVESPDIDKLQREAFNAARYTITGYPCAEGMKPIDGGFWHKTYEDYKNSKK